MNRAEILAEALPYIEKFHGSYIVIKYGGHAMLDDEAKDWTVKDTILLKYVGMKPVIVHGGGPEITQAMEKMGKKPKFVEGLRVTDEETLDIVKMVLVGKINTDIVSRINKFNGKGVGLSGKDGKLILAKKRVHKILKKGLEKEVDLGLVGETVKVNPEAIQILTDKGFIPVVSPIGITEEGSSLNLNSDTVAGDLAVALGARKLVILTDVPGVMRDLNEKNSLINAIKVSKVDSLLKENVVEGSMIPKLQACANAVSGGVERAHIIDGRVKHSVLLELLTDEGIGTMIKEG